MTDPRRSWIPRRRPGVRVVGERAGGALVTVEGRVRSLALLRADQLEALLAACDGRRDAAAVARELEGSRREETVREKPGGDPPASSPRNSPGLENSPRRESPSALEHAVLEALEALDGLVLDWPSIEPGGLGPVAVWGSGEGKVAREVVEALRSAQVLAPRRLLMESQGVPSVPRDASLVVLAPDQASYRWLTQLASAVEAAALPCLPVSCEAGALWVGPLLLPRRLRMVGGEQSVQGEAPLKASRRLLFAPGASAELREHWWHHGGSEVPGAELELALRRAAVAAAREARRVLSGRRPKQADSVLRVQADGSVGASPLAPPTEPIDGRWQSVADGVVADWSFPEPRPRRWARGGPRRVGILGGGTAGYLAALALRRKLPAVEVTLLESPEIPVIGVGEATTPLLPAFLHGTLGIDPVDFWRRVQPTPKLGIRFVWGPEEGPESFSYPFVRGALVESWAHRGDLESASLPALLMAAGRMPVMETGGRLGLLPHPWAYHLENRRFVAFLRDAALAAGVRRREVTVSAALPRVDGTGLDHLRLQDGSRASFDLYLDCTGFRSLLLGEALDEPFLDFRSSLFTDAAWVAAVERAPGAPPVPYTEAETWDAGWCWNTPTREDDHRGYVFSRSFLEPEAALAEMHRRLPGLGEVRLVTFAPGRRANFWRGNVAALGNAYGFVEPLESTALHMLVVSIQLLIRHWPGEEGVEGDGLSVSANQQTANQRQANAFLGQFWDDLRGFLALHFRFNRRLDTAFWRACREEVDLAGAEESVALFQQRGPLAYSPHTLRFDSLWGDYGRDVLLLGQGVPCPLPAPRMDAATFRRRLAAAQRWMGRCLPVEQGLQRLENEPAALRRWARSAPWLQDGAVGGGPHW
ncbi:MAG: tryptophan halogenase family protein [Acidobacteriota bacterium]